MKPELISFKLCPFVQRSVIVLLEKGVDFDITYINLQDPPGWFGEISPLGKVPVLKVGSAVVFESAVIMEYLDEVNPPSLHPVDPLRKAMNRAWIEFASGLFFTQFQMARADTEELFEEKRGELRGALEKLEQQVVGPHFNGGAFNLVDAAYAPFFMRAALLERWHPLGLLTDLPRLHAWREALLERKSVRGSVVEEFEELFRGHLAAVEGYGPKLFTG